MKIAELEEAPARRPVSTAPLIAAAGLLALVVTAVRGARSRKQPEPEVACPSDTEAATHLLAVEAEDYISEASEEDSTESETDRPEDCTWE